MKKIFILGFIVLASVVNLKGQKVDTTVIPPVSNVLIVDTAEIVFYGGLVGSGFVKTSPEEVIKYANLRVGMSVKKKLDKNYIFSGWITYDPGKNELTLFNGSIQRSWKDFTFSAGYQATPVTLIRPYPLSTDGQFQFTAEALPPNSALGGSIFYKDLGVGLYSRNGKPEWNIAYGKKIQIGAWGINERLKGLTVKSVFPRIYFMTTATSENRQALALSIKPTTKTWSIVWNFSLYKGSVSDNLAGILIPIETKSFTTTSFGGGYNVINHSAGIFFLISLDHKN